MVWLKQRWEWMYTLDADLNALAASRRAREWPTSAVVELPPVVRASWIWSKITWQYLRPKAAEPSSSTSGPWMSNVDRAPSAWWN